MPKSKSKSKNFVLICTNCADAGANSWFIPNLKENMTTDDYGASIVITCSVCKKSEKLR